MQVTSNKATMGDQSIALGAVIGAVWGLTIALVLGIALALIFGYTVSFTLMVGAISGIAGALAWMLLDDGGKAGPFDQGRLLKSGGAFALVTCLLTFFSPLGLALTKYWLAGPLTLVIMSALLVLSVAMCFGSENWRTVRRYKFELVVMRCLKGLGFVIFTIMVALPFYVMLMTSFKKRAEILQNPLDLSIDFSRGAELFSSYVELFTKYNFGTFILNSALVSVLTVILTLAAAIPGAYAVSRLKFPGRKAFSRTILLIYMVPAIVLVIPLYTLFSKMGLRDTMWGLIILYPATTIPVALYMLQGYFRGLPAELEEAGLMDGCSRLGVIWRITMPLSLPAIASVSLYVFMIAWNEFLFSLIFLESRELFTLPRGVNSLNSSEVPRQHLMAGSVIVTVPVLVIFLWFERFMVQGLTAGSVKG